MIKLVVSDLDGTLFNSSHELDEEDSKMITELQIEGFQFMVATGRNKESAIDIVEQFGIHCDYVFLNGAMIMNQKREILQETPLNQSALCEVIDLMNKEDVCFHMYGLNGTITFDAQRGKTEALAHMMRNGFSKEEALHIMERGKFGEYDMVVDNQKAYLDSQPVIYKIELFSTDEKRQANIREQLSKLVGIEVTNSVADNIEITDQYAQKGFALKYYCEQHGIKLDEVLVFGDSLNDLNMMQVFPYSFAVENASEQIKKHAKYLTSSNEEHGVIRVIRELLVHKGNEDFLKAFKKLEK